MKTCVQRKSPTPESSRRSGVDPFLDLAIVLGLSISSFAQLAAGPSSQLTIAGWPMAKWEMTEPEVLKAFGGAAKSLNEGTSPETELRAAIGIDNVGVGGVSFRALFLFDQSDKLERIHLYGPAPSRPPDSQFRKVEDYLTGKYGEPFSGTMGDSARSVWILQNSVIQLDYLPMAILDLTFEKRDGQTKESVMSGFIEAHRKHVRAIEQAISLPSGKSSSSVKSESAAQFGKWRVSRSKSQFDDSPTVALTLSAENSIKGWLVTSTPQLILRCQEGQTEAFVATGMAAAVEQGAVDLHTVRLRYGNDAAFTILMSQSTDNRSLFFPDPMMKIIGMWNIQQLVVGFTPFNANPVAIRFDVSGLANAIQPLRDACGW